VYLLAAPIAQCMVSAS